MPFFQFFFCWCPARSRSVFFFLDVNESQHEPLQRRSVHLLCASELFVFNHGREPWIGQLLCRDDVSASRLPKTRRGSVVPARPCGHGTGINAPHSSLTLCWERIRCTLWSGGEPGRCCCFGLKAPTLLGISPSVLQTWTKERHGYSILLHGWRTWILTVPYLSKNISLVSSTRWCFFLLLMC